MAQHEDMLIGSSLWRQPSRSPTFHQNIPPTHSPLPSSSRLEHFRNRQEAAISFEDDLEFNPSLTPEEVNEARRNLANLAASHSTSPPSPQRIPRSLDNSPPMFSSTRAIPIIDPTNKTPLSLPAPPPKSTRSPPPQYVRPTNTTTSATAFSSIFPPSQPPSVNPYSPPPLWASPWDLKPTRVAPPLTRSIPIVDPSSGSVLNASPDRRAFYAAPATQQQRMGGTGPTGWCDVTVR